VDPSSQGRGGRKRASMRGVGGGGGGGGGGGRGGEGGGGTSKLKTGEKIRPCR